MQYNTKQHINVYRAQYSSAMLNLRLEQSLGRYLEVCWSCVAGGLRLARCVFSEHLYTVIQRVLKKEASVLSA